MNWEECKITDLKPGDEVQLEDTASAYQGRVKGVAVMNNHYVLTLHNNTLYILMEAESAYRLRKQSNISPAKLRPGDRVSFEFNGSHLTRQVVQDKMIWMECLTLVGDRRLFSYSKISNLILHNREDTVMANALKVGQVVEFVYDGGSNPGGKRRVKVSEVDNSYLKGVDLDDGGTFKQFYLSSVKSPKVVSESSDEVVSVAVLRSEYKLPSSTKDSDVLTVAKIHRPDVEVSLSGGYITFKKKVDLGRMTSRSTWSGETIIHFVLNGKAVTVTVGPNGGPARDTLVKLAELLKD